MKGPPREDLPAEHDGSYKRMFGHKALVEALLRRFVAREWADELDFETLESVKTHFVGPGNRRRDSDLIWRLRWKEHQDEWFYVYVQVEFQSKPDPFMALRALTYLCLLYEDLVQRKELSPSGRLPPVLPVVLYNGRPPWRKPLEFAELVEPPPEALRPFLPDFRFLLVDEGRLTRRELEPVDNPASVLFSLEQARTNEEVYEGVRNLLNVTESPSMEHLRADMLAWIVRSLLPARKEVAELELSKLLEDPQMLADTVKDWPARWMAEGRAEGLRKALRRMLELKFGPRSSVYTDRLEDAGEDTLLLWTERLLSAEEPGDIFRD